MKQGHPLGLHRVLSPSGALPQAALTLDNSPEIYDTEILINVEILNITSASFSRLKKETGSDKKILADIIMKIVKERGKYQDPALNSGGVLIGTVAAIGSSVKNSNNLSVGDRVATLMSLTATPLHLETITDINLTTDQVFVKGKAMIFEKGVYCRIPDDLPLEIALAVMDVAGAPAMVAKKVKAGDTVLVMGGGKAGLLCLHEAKKITAAAGQTIALRKDAKRCEEIMDLGIADAAIAADVTKPLEVMEAVQRATHGTLADFTIDVVNVENAEMAAILSTKDDGVIFFYNIATSFTKAALGAESVGKPVEMLIGNGFVPHHAELTFQIMRENEPLKNYFLKMYTKK